jgi:hypothetical protein
MKRVQAMSQTFAGFMASKGKVKGEKAGRYRYGIGIITGIYGRCFDNNRDFKTGLSQ